MKATTETLQTPEKKENENLVKISARTNVKGVIRYIVELFKTKNFDFVQISGLNQAISHVVLVAEVVKTQVLGLHQVNTIDCLILNSTENTGGKEEYIRRTPKLEIILSKNEPKVKTSGYQKPYSESEIKNILCKFIF